MQMRSCTQYQIHSWGRLLLEVPLMVSSKLGVWPHRSCSWSLQLGQLTS